MVSTLVAYQWDQVGKHDPLMEGRIDLVGPTWRGRELMWAMSIEWDILARRLVILARLDPVTYLADKA